MELNKITMFSVMKKRLSWLTQRQEVLAHNVANADTPGYRARDLKGFKFEQLVKSEGRQLNINVTSDNHLGGSRKRLRDYNEVKERRPYETSPDGNSVVLEEQAAKINETSVSHRLTTELYKKNLELLSIAIGRR